MAQPYMSSRSPPPLQHPKPTHPAYPPPEPPKTPGGSTNSSPYSQAQRISSDGGYQRYSSPPVDGGSSAATATATGYAPSSLGSASGFAGYGPQAGGLPGSEAHNRNGYVHAPSPGQPQGYGQVPPTGPGQAQNFGGWQVNDATTQMGVQFGKSAVAAGQDYVEKNFTRYLPLQLIKTSFAVTNSYVLLKLRLILFPWRHKTWTRQIRRSNENGAMEGWQPPRDDINAPDLYIPMMALVTYCLLSALSSGLQARFHPEVLGYSLSKAMAVVVVEFCAIKLGCYLLDVKGTGASGVELIGYGGYKFVGIIVTILFGFLRFGTMTSILVFIYVYAANFFFLLRSLKYVLLPDPSQMSAVTSATLSHSQRSRRIQFLFITAASQVLWMWWLSRV